MRLFFLTRQFMRENLVGQQENVKADVSASFSVSSSYSFFAVYTYRHGGRIRLASVGLAQARPNKPVTVMCVKWNCS